MSIRRHHAPGDFVLSARQARIDNTHERVNIVRIVRNLELSARSVGPAKSDLTQVRNDLLAEDESNSFRRLR
jgi:hypothetical protein